MKDSLRNSPLCLLPSRCLRHLGLNRPGLRDAALSSASFEGVRCDLTPALERCDQLPRHLKATRSTQHSIEVTRNLATIKRLL